MKSARILDVWRVTVEVDFSPALSSCSRPASVSVVDDAVPLEVVTLSAKQVVVLEPSRWSHVEDRFDRRTIRLSELGERNNALSDDDLTRVRSIYYCLGADVERIRTVAKAKARAAIMQRLETAKMMALAVNGWPESAADGDEP